MNETRLFELYSYAKQYLGCGSNSCLFVRPKGMGTNGHCSCIEQANPGVRPALAAIWRVLQEEFETAKGESKMATKHNHTETEIHATAERLSQAEDLLKEALGNMTDQIQTSEVDWIEKTAKFLGQEVA